MTTFDKIKPIIAQALGVSESLIVPTLAMDDIEEWDSMGNMAILSQIEELIGISFPLEDLFDLTSVRAIVESIDKIQSNL